MQPRDMTHECPAPECDQRVMRERYACARDWFRLPSELRAAINRAYRRGDSAAHRTAVLDAKRWYEEHPRTSPPGPVYDPELPDVDQEDDQT